MHTLEISPPSTEAIEPVFIPDEIPIAERQSTWRIAKEWLTSSGIGRLATLATAALSFSSIAVSMEATPAEADPAITAEVIDTGGQGLWLHAGSPSGKLDVTIPDGDNFDITCWKTGVSVDGYTAWLKGTDEQSGHTGYASDAYLYTNTDTSNEDAELLSQGVPECDNPASTNQQPSVIIDNSPNNDTITVPSNSAPAPWDISTTSKHDLVDHVMWTPNQAGYGETLEVFMTQTGKDDSTYDPNHAFQEVADDAHLSHNSPYWGTMQDQFDCHATVVARVAYDKPSWNLDTERPDLGVEGDILSSCNPQ